MALNDYIGLWRMNESSGNAQDTSANAYHLTNNNTVAYAAGLMSNAADFGTANTNKSLTIANNLAITGGAIAISGWVKMQTELASSGGGGTLIFGQGSATNFVGYYITYDFNAGTRRLNFNRQQQFVSNNVVSITATLGTTVWHHVVLSWTGGTLFTYLDGVAGSVLGCSGNGTGGTTDIYAVASDTSNQYAQGFLNALTDTLIVYNHSLTAAEVTTLYNAGVGYDPSANVAPASLSIKW